MSHILKKFMKIDIDPNNVRNGLILTGVNQNDVILNAELQMYYESVHVSLKINRNGLKQVGFPLPIYGRVEGIGLNIVDGKLQIIADHADADLIQGLEDLLGSLNTLGSNYEQIIQVLENQNMKVVLEPYSMESGTIKLRLVQGEGAAAENQSTGLW